MTGRSLLFANLAAIVASCLLGSAVVATRSAVEEIPPLPLAFLRYGQGAAILLAILALLGSESLRLDRLLARKIAILGFLQFALFPVLFNISLQHTTASRGGVLIGTMPLWTLLFARRFGLERLDVRQISGVVMSFVGVATVFAESGLIGSTDRDQLIGNLIMLCVAAIGGLYGVLAKPVISDHGAMPVTAFAMTAGAGLLLVPAMADGMPSAITEASSQSLALAAFLGIFAGAIAFWLFSVALSLLSPTRTMVYVNLNPVAATLLGVVLLDEPLTPSFLAGFALILAGLALTNFTRQSPIVSPAEAV